MSALERYLLAVTGGATLGVYAVDTTPIGPNFVVGTFIGGVIVGLVQLARTIVRIELESRRRRRELEEGSR